VTLRAAASPAPLVLASASPRRLHLLRQVGIEPGEVLPADVDESAGPKELPPAYAGRVARDKAAKVAGLRPDAFVLAADTVVAAGRRILPKAETEEQARDCLRLLSGGRHRVYGGVCAMAPGGAMAERVVVTVVAFARLADAAVDAYLAGGEWHGKAGGYGIQGRAALFVRFLRGSYSNVVGLPLFETARLLRGLGYPVPALP
jgi:septum formation protein